jgi:hypothetical protein
VEEDFFAGLLRDLVEVLFFDEDDFLDEPPAFFADDFDDLLDLDAFDDDDFFDGTLPPSLRASDRPMAIACFLLVTFLPEPPLRSVPRFRSCIAFSTFSLDFLPYLLAMQNPPAQVGVQAASRSIRRFAFVNCE